MAVEVKGFTRRDSKLSAASQTDHIGADSTEVGMHTKEEKSLTPVRCVQYTSRMLLVPGVPEN